MRKTLLLNSEVSYEISKIGHTQSLCIGDCGLPVPGHVKRIDLALSKNIPRFIDVLSAVLSEMKVEKAIFAKEFMNSPVHKEALACLKRENSEIIIEYIGHTEFKQKTNETAAVVRTGEQTPFANVLLVSGVVF